MTNPLEDGLMQQDYKHSITPPPELVKQWCHDRDRWIDFENVLAIRAAQWGADAELTAYCAWIGGEIGATDPNDLYAARRHKSQSLKERALEAFEAIKLEGDSVCVHLKYSDWDYIRRALENLDD
jgi:hypothetical protein